MRWSLCFILIETFWKVDVSAQIKALSSELALDHDDLNATKSVQLMPRMPPRRSKAPRKSPGPRAPDGAVDIIERLLAVESEWQRNRVTPTPSLLTSAIPSVPPMAPPIDPSMAPPSAPPINPSMAPPSAPPMARPPARGGAARVLENMFAIEPERSPPEQPPGGQGTLRWRRVWYILTMDIDQVDVKTTSNRGYPSIFIEGGDGEPAMKLGFNEYYGPDTERTTYRRVVTYPVAGNEVYQPKGGGYTNPPRWLSWATGHETNQPNSFFWDNEQGTGIYHSFWIEDGFFTAGLTLLSPEQHRVARTGAIDIFINRVFQPIQPYLEDAFYQENFNRAWRWEAMSQFNLLDFNYMIYEESTADLVRGTLGSGGAVTVWNTKGPGPNWKMQQPENTA
ncbi:MAG: hypothetical protein M1833_003898 [Piccolia ochrophora]|nr:MAG: hypothetical protein M1833_003898 [Piccolia ochrophora]